MTRPWRGAAVISLVAAPLFLFLTATPAGADSPMRVSIIGDSVAASISASMPARRVFSGYAMAIDAQVCRRTAARSCRWKGHTPTTVRDVVRATKGDLGDVVVIVSGYNDDPRRFARDVTNTLHDVVAAGVSQVVWLDLRIGPGLSPTLATRYRAMNATLHDLDRVSPVLHVAPWDAFSRGHDSWFFDSMHLRSRGAVRLARFIRAQLSTLHRTGLRQRTTTRAYRCARSAAGGWSPGPVTAAPSSAAGDWTTTRKPAVLLDTRPDPHDGVGRPVGARRVVRIGVAGRPRIPMSAEAASIRVRVVSACSSGRLELGGCGMAPSAAFGFTRRGALVQATVPLGAFGRVCLRTTAQADVRVELLAWATPTTR